MRNLNTEASFANSPLNDVKMGNSTATAINDHRPKVTDWEYTYWPAFAKFIREHHLVDFTKEQLRLCEEIDLPLLKKLAYMSAEQLFELSLQSQEDLLQHVESNTLKERFEKSMKQWNDDDLKIVEQKDIAIEDFISGMQVRKQSFMKFLRLYTTDMDLALKILEEIDIHERLCLSAGTEQYLTIFRKELNKQLYFIEHITNTVPGGICIYNLDTYAFVYNNDGIYDMLNYTKDQLTNLETDILTTLVHPDDIARLQHDLANMTTLAKDEVRTIDCRVKNGHGNYIWVRAYISPFLNGINSESKIIAFITNIQEEKINAEKLKHSQEQLLEAQELANIGSYHWDIEDNVLDVTPQYLKIFEIDDISQRSEYIKRIHPADVDRVMSARDRAVNETGVFDTEYRYIVNNREKIIWSKGKVLMENDRKVMKGTIMDVTDQKYMRMRLQRSEMLYKQAEALAKVGNWTWNIAAGKLEWSDEMYRIHDMEPTQEVTYDNMREVIHPEDMEMVRTAVWGAVERAEPFDMEYRIITRENNEKALRMKARVMMDHNGKVYKMLGTVQDITKEYYYNQQIKDSRELARKIAETSPTLIALYDVNEKKFDFVNKSFETVLGYNPAVVYEQGGEFMMNIIHPEDRERIIKENDAAMQQANAHPPGEGEDEPVLDFTYRMKCSGGIYHWFHTYRTIFDRDKEGKVNYVLDISTDITKQVEAETLLMQNNTQLKQSNKSLEEFAFITSHDLKEPLRKISTFSERLSAKYQDHLDGDGRKYLDKIASSAKRMQTMIDDLMALSRLDGNDAFEKCNLNTVLSDTLSVLENKIIEKGAVVTADKLPVVSVVPIQFRQLFQNLIGNSLKFAHPEKLPAIHVSWREIDGEEVKGYNLPPHHQYIRLDFADNGIGFDQEHADKIFMTFQRLHSKSEIEGNGIGLSICRKVADNHYGIIQAEGKPGEGAVFSIIIPKNPDYVKKMSVEANQT
ncbi:MAG TPA: PAS domain-containing protein [Flavipsychrobacter sp.]